jgi:hypothetical protein
LRSIPAPSSKGRNEGRRPPRSPEAWEAGSDFWRRKPRRAAAESSFKPDSCGEESADEKDEDKRKEGFKPSSSDGVTFEISPKRDRISGLEKACEKKSPPNEAQILPQTT